jgi:hypothetical protein
MSRKLFSLLALVFLICILALALSRQQAVRGAVTTYASPIQAGCYLAQHDLCKIHVEPFTINLGSGRKLVYFQFLTTQAGTGTQRVIYDFRPDLSNPVPFTGDTFTPSLVKKDFAATCGQQYTLSLQGQDTGDASAYNLGSTGQFTCPEGIYYSNLPLISK